MKTISAVLAAVFVPAVLLGQAPAPPARFEVISVRPAPPSGPTPALDVGVHLDGSQVRINGYSIRDFLARAYHVNLNQITGPDWTSGDRFNLSATLPAGSTASQIPEMLQAFLAERFQLKMHREKKDLAVYALVIGKPPLKLKESPPSAGAPESPGAVNAAIGASAAGVSANLGNGSSYSLTNNGLEAKKITMTVLAGQLERYLDRPVVDRTGLKGIYDLTLPITQDDFGILMVRAAANAGIALPPQAMRLLEVGSPSSLFDAFQQLGLKLDSRKEPMDVLVIDQALKAPTEN